VGEKDVMEAKLRARIQVLERALKRAEQAQVSQAEIRQKIFGLAAAPPREIAAIKPKSGHAEGTPGVPVLLLSDWHVGETVHPDSAGGNRYNSQVVYTRASNLVANAVNVIDLQWKALGERGKPTQIILPLLGDFVSGEIHDELARTNDVDPLPSVLAARDILLTVIRSFAAQYGRVICPCVSGNHGRTDRKPTAKHALWRNLDWLIYTLLERDLSGDKRVTVFTPSDNMAFFDVHGVRFLAMHGHDLGVKGGDGIIGSVGPIMRGRAKMAAFCEARRTPFDTLLLGHWHQHMMLPGVVVNGTLKGPDEYTLGVLRARPEPAGQALFFVHPRYGITSHWLIRVEDKTARGTR
jgi:predicted phosphodiesterase